MKDVFSKLLNAKFYSYVSEKNELKEVCLYILPRVWAVEHVSETNELKELASEQGFEVWQPQVSEKNELKGGSGRVVINVATYMYQKRMN